MYKPVGHTISQQDSVPVPWVPPPIGWIKLNFDAAVSREGLVGISFVARDSTGLVLAWSRKKLHGRFDVETAELYAAQLATSLARDLNYHRIILEGDALLVIKNLQHQKRTRALNDNVYAAVCHTLSHFSGFKVQHVHRNANRLAHQLCHHFTEDSHGFSSLPFDYEEIL